MSAPPPPPLDKLPLIKPLAPIKQTNSSGKKSALIEKAQNSLKWRTSKAALHSFTLNVSGFDLILECKPMTGNSETATGSTIWDCSIVFSKYLTDYCSSLPDGYWDDKTVLEVGSGTGVAGLACSVLFKNATVILSDMPVLTPLIKRNVDSNRERLGSALTNNLSVQDFTWGTTPNLNPSPPFDYIIVSDCVWPKIDNSLLVDALRQVSNLETNIILIYEFRDISCRKTFFERAKQYFTFNCISQNTDLDYCPDDIEIYHIKRKESDYPLNK